MKRRDFLKATGVVAAGSLLPGSGSAGKAVGKSTAIPSLLPSGAVLDGFVFSKNGNIVPELRWRGPSVAKPGLALYANLAKFLGRDDQLANLQRDIERADALKYKIDGMLSDGSAGSPEFIRIVDEADRLRGSIKSFKNSLEVSPEDFGRFLAKKVSVKKLFGSDNLGSSLFYGFDYGYNRGTAPERLLTDSLSRMLSAYVDGLGGPAVFKRLLWDSVDAWNPEENGFDALIRLSEIPGFSKIVPGFDTLLKKISDHWAGFDVEEDMDEVIINKKDSLDDLEPDWYAGDNDDPFFRSKERFHESKIICLTSAYRRLVSESGR